MSIEISRTNTPPSVPFRCPACSEECWLNALLVDGHVDRDGISQFCRTLQSCPFCTSSLIIGPSDFGIKAKTPDSSLENIELIADATDDQILDRLEFKQREYLAELRTMRTPPDGFLTSHQRAIVFVCREFARAHAEEDV